MKTKVGNRAALWSRHDAEWRHPAQIASHWREAAAVDPKLLAGKARGDWWRVLEKTKATLLVTREYEHLVMALCVRRGRPLISFLPIPHPSGLAVNRKNGIVYLASTRNPNQVFDLAPVRSASSRDHHVSRPLLPVRSRFFPGRLYLHDLALLNGALVGNAVGQNAVIRIDPDGSFKKIWWPRCIEVKGADRFDRNYLQLNSIAAGKDLAHSYFSASAERISNRRPGHRNFPVDRRGVIFSGATREPIVRGLTRPHSARLFRSRIWVNNSGYGEVGYVTGKRFETVARLPGWTRGLCFCSGIVFVGTSRVIPRFRQYAPGLDLRASACGVHAVDVRTGKTLGSLIWPHGNQIFAVDWLPRNLSEGFPFRRGATKASKDTTDLFYTFETATN